MPGRASRRRAAVDPGARRARRVERAAPRRHVAGRPDHGPRRRPDRGAQGHRRPPGAPRLPSRATTCGRPSTARRSWPRPGRSSPTTSSSKWGTCEHRPTTDTDEPIRRATSRRATRRLDWIDARACRRRASRSSRRYVSGGSQNEIYEIRRGDLHGALRIPPPTAPETRDDGILREWRIIEALDGTDVPHTPAHRRCATTTSVLGRTFYLMGFVDGWSPMQPRPQWPEPFDSDLEQRRGLAYRAGRRHRAAVEGRLAGEGPRRTSAGPTASTSARSTGGPRFLDRIKGRELPGLDEASAWLRAHRPIDFVPGHHARRLPVRQRDVPPRRRRPGWPPSSTGRWAPSATRKLDLAWVVHELARRHRRAPASLGYVDLTGMPTHGRAARALRASVGPPGRRHRLLRRARPLEAGHRARAGLPARRRRPEARRRSAPSSST